MRRLNAFDYISPQVVAGADRGAVGANGSPRCSSVAGGKIGTHTFFGSGHANPGYRWRKRCASPFFPPRPRSTAASHSRQRPRDPPPPPAPPTVPAHSPAISATPTFVYASAEQAAAVFAEREPGYVYSRFTNP